jgi:hypothetical protein
MRRLILFVLVYTLTAAAQGAPDPALLAQIQKIPAIDNHTHVMKVTAPGEHDDEFDALPCDTLEAWDAAFFTARTARKSLTHGRRCTGMATTTKVPSTSAS